MNSDQSVALPYFGKCSGNVYALAVLLSAGKPKLAVGSYTESIDIWDIATQKREAVLRQHDHSVLSLAPLRGGKLASGSYDCTIRIWKVLSHDNSTCEILYGHNGGVNDLVQLPNSNKLASCSSDTTIRIWDLDSPEHDEFTLRGHESSVNTLTVLPDDKLSSGSSDKTIRIWDISTRQCKIVLRGHDGAVATMAVLPNNTLASGGEDGTVRLWNLTSQQCELELRGHEGAVNALIVLSNDIVVSGGDDTSIRAWNLASGRCDVIKENTGAVRCLAVVSADTIASGCADGLLRWHELEFRDEIVAFAELISSPLLNSYSSCKSKTACHHSYIKRFAGWAYTFGGYAPAIRQLREHYQERCQLSHVLRVHSGEKKVNLGHFFVNLALVRHVDHVARERGLLYHDGGDVLSLDRGALYDRLFTENRYCAVEDILGSLEDRSKSVGWILVIGRAGTGKTTLTHYLAYQWGQKYRLWYNRFDVVFRVKLNLAADDRIFGSGASAASDLTALIYASLDRSEHFDTTFISYVIQKLRSVTLILLDGFDEILKLYSENQRVKSMIDFALGLPNGILTSRPVTFPNMKCTFRETYENIGLSEENVRAYVVQYFSANNSSNGDSLLENLRNNPSLMKLAQIPVNLNALCSIWQDQTRAMEVGKCNLLTMTGVYDRMVLSVLWHRNAKNILTTTELAFDDNSVRSNNWKHLRVLATLAYKAFELGQTQILSSELLKGSETLAEDMSIFTKEWGLLRAAEAVGAFTSGTTVAHYFIHLTFQEYFVALYFAEVLVPKKSESPQERKERLTDIQVLAKKILSSRHEARYAIIWVFLAGLLVRAPYAQYADYYWDALLPETVSHSCIPPDPVLPFAGAARTNRSARSSVSWTMPGVHPTSSIVCAYGAVIRECIFGSKEVGGAVPKRLAPVLDRMKSVLQWQLICEDAGIVPLGDELTCSTQERQMRRCLLEGRRRQLIYDLQRLNGHELDGKIWTCLSGYRFNFSEQAASVPPELASLNSANKLMRMSCVRALFQQLNYDSMDRLENLIFSDDDVRVRSMALIAWYLQTQAADGSPQKQKDVDRRIEACLKDPNPELRRSAVLVLGARAWQLPRDEQVKAIDGLKVLMQPATEEDVSVRVACAQLFITIDNDGDAFRCLINSLQDCNPRTRMVILSCLKERVGCCVDDSIVLHLLLTVVEVHSFTAAELVDITIILRRIRPEMYGRMELELLTKPNIARGFVESLWLHMGSSTLMTPELQRAEETLLDVLSTDRTIGRAVKSLREPLSLPLLTRIFEQSFPTDGLNECIERDEYCQGNAHLPTSVAKLQRCCQFVEDSLSLDTALFGPDSCLTFGMDVREVQTVRNAKNICDSELDEVIGHTNMGLAGINRDFLLAIRLYTLKTSAANPKPEIFKLLNFPFYNPDNRDHDSLRNQLPFMKYMLRSFDALYGVPNLSYTGPGYRGMQVEASPYLTRKYRNWQQEFEVGKKLTFPSFTSVSLSIQIAEEYAVAGERIIFKFMLVVGLRLRDISSENEQEVLLKPPAVFIIRGADMKTDGTLDVLLEVDTTSTLTYL
jgi:hypothetical protein